LRGPFRDPKPVVRGRLDEIAVCQARPDAPLFWLGVRVPPHRRLKPGSECDLLSPDGDTSSSATGLRIPFARMRIRVGDLSPAGKHRGDVPAAGRANGKGPRGPGGSMRRYRILAVVFTGIHLLSFVFLVIGVEPFLTFFYSFVWWSFILLVASVNRLWGKESLVLQRPAGFAWLAVTSVLVWVVFEIYNFRLANWSYLGLPFEIYLRWPGYLVAFATVLPAILEMERLLANIGVADGLKGPRFVVPKGLLIRFSLLGILLLCAPLLSPSLYFPLVWVGFIFLLEPIVYRRVPAGSLLRRAQDGRYGVPVRLMASGFVCGLLWEFWNHWAGAKWIYTLPRFDFLKVFEMPILGYLGFPFFALECYLFYQLALLVRARTTRRRLWMLTPVVVALVAFALNGIDERTVVTFRLFFHW
jgi:hypothetical protein